MIESDELMKSDLSSEDLPDDKQGGVVMLSVSCSARNIVRAFSTAIELLWSCRAPSESCAQLQTL